MLYIIIYNVSSVQRIVDIARFILTFTKKNEVPVVVFSRISGSAAQTGIAEVSKLAYKLGRSILITENLEDTLEIIKPSKAYILSTNGITVEEVIKESLEKDIAVILPGSESAFSKYDLSLATEFKVENLSEENGIVPLVAIALYKIISEIRCKQKSIS